MNFGHPSLTFMGIPASRLARSRLSILGVPLDSGHHALRGGSRLGPESVRRQSRLLNRYSIEDDLDVLDATGLYDAGDVDIVHGDIPASHTAVTAAVGALLAEGQTSITIGGDGTVTLPQLRAVAVKYPKFAVVHVDAHTDAYPYQGYIGATAFTRAVEENLLDPEKSFHVGIRGPVAVGGLKKFATDLGYHVVTMRELRKQGIEAIAARIKNHVGDTPVYLCYDVDFFEPSIVPGVFTPLCDGALPHEGLELLRCFSGMNIVHFDINNVTPQYDVHGFTALLAAQIIWTCVDMFARSGRSGELKGT